MRSNPPQAPRVTLRVLEVSQMLGTSPAFVRLEIARGHLPVVRLGRAIAIPADALRDYVAARTEHGKGGAGR